jgi:hypothetical protein
MKELSRWDKFVDWFDFVLLRKIGIVKLKHHRGVVKYYNDWLIDIAEAGSISDDEIKNILRWNVDEVDTS